MAKINWVPIICSIVTVCGTIVTAYLTNGAKSSIESLKAQTQKQIREIELKSQADITRLRAQLDAEKDLRAQSVKNEAIVRSERAKECDEVKAIRDDMSSDFTHLRFNDLETSAALLRLESASSKITAYFSPAARTAYKASLPKEPSSDQLQRYREVYGAVLEGYNKQVTISCAK
ncbi:hypothetical protein [Massilia sp. 9096]|uniref:hypothetical protein n=1 Tax=Massilia sp. 9096 TaxID=1500894 RepID=UPI0012E03C48|nr:hypothetical protein [Massilia sp. 9096]